MSLTLPHAMTAESYKASMPQSPRKYAVHELLAMRLTLPHVSCPLDKFTQDAWEYAIVKVKPANPSYVRNHCLYFPSVSSHS